MKKAPFQISSSDLASLQTMAENPDGGAISRRSKIVILRAKGLSLNETAKATKTTRQTVALWQKRYTDQGLPGLRGKAGGGKAGRMPASIRESLLKSALEAREKGLDVSCRGLSRSHGVSPSTVSRFLKHHGLGLSTRSKALVPAAAGEAKRSSIPKRRVPLLRPTLLDVARVAGVDPSTASRAINGKRGVSTQTRTKVDRAVSQLAYRKDPLLSGLAVHRQAKVASRRETVIAMIADSRQAYPRFSLLDGIRDEIKIHTHRLGFGCELMEISPGNAAPGRLRRILLSRGISAVIFLPMATPQRRLEMNMDSLFPVAIGRTLQYPNIHRVAEDNRASVSLIIKHLREYGYKRFGMILPKWSDYRTEFSWRAGFLTEQSQLQSGEEAAIISPERPAQSDSTWWRRQFDWIKSYKPDVLISLYKYDTILKEATNNGIRIPEQMGYACLTSQGEDGPESGIYQNSRTVARLAVEKAVSLYYQNHQGVPSYPTTTLVAGNWATGRTLIPRDELKPLQ